MPKINLQSLAGRYGSLLRLSRHLEKGTRESDRRRDETIDTMVLQTGRRPRRAFRQVPRPRYGIQLSRLRLPCRLVRGGIAVRTKTVRGR